MKKLLTGGLVWHPEGFIRQDILIDNEHITRTGINIQEPYAETLDCKGVFIMPAFVDMHVHVGEKTGGMELADDFSSLSRLADSSGIAAIGAFVTERQEHPKQQKTLRTLLKQAQAKAESEFKHQVRWHLIPTVSEPQDVIPLLKEGCDLKFHTTYKQYGMFRSYSETEVWMKELKDHKPRMLIHCEDDEVVSIMSSLHPFKRSFDHTLRRPEMAESLAVERVLDSAVQHNYPVHIVHVSTPEAALLVAQAKKSAPVTCETAPHYLLLNENKLKEPNGYRWLCTPPLRTENSRGRLVELLQDGLFDAVATDHCPFTKQDKDKHQNSPEQVPNGIAGMGAAFPLLHAALVKTGKLTLEKLVTYLSANPARILNIHPAYGAIEAGAVAALILMQEQPLQEALPVIASLADTHNPWQNYTHNLNYYLYSTTHDNK